MYSLSVCECMCLRALSIKDWKKRSRVWLDESINLLWHWFMWCTSTHPHAGAVRCRAGDTGCHMLAIYFRIIFHRLIRTNCDAILRVACAQVNYSTCTTFVDFLFSSLLSRSKVSLAKSLNCTVQWTFHGVETITKDFYFSLYSLFPFKLHVGTIWRRTNGKLD